MRASHCCPSLFLLLSLVLVSLSPADSELSEFEKHRQNEYNKRGYSWPVPEYVPNTAGWKQLFDHRLRQVAEIQDYSKRYEGYAQTLSAALVQPNFTEHGFGLARAPDALMEDLRQAIREGLEAGPREEEDLAVIEGESPPWFIDRPDLTKRVLMELQHYPETWSGIELTPVIAYGFRLYRNNTNLRMHVDQSHTHIISFILHIDSSDDSEPWPIMIEDLNGNTHEVVLTSGDILFYESSKCFHGRPRKFKGSWYTSVFVHYQPTYIWPDESMDKLTEKIYAIPPDWSNDPTTKYEIPLELSGTGMLEPTCPNNWCSSEHSIKWSGPGQEGYWIAPTGQKYPFDPKPLACEDWDTRCPEWASWESDECKNNLKYMLSHCKKSCGACSGVSEGTVETLDS